MHCACLEYVLVANKFFVLPQDFFSYDLGIDESPSPYSHAAVNALQKHWWALCQPGSLWQ